MQSKIVLQENERVQAIKYCSGVNTMIIFFKKSIHKSRKSGNYAQNSK